MIHSLTIGIFSAESYFNERQLRVLGLLDRDYVETLIERHQASLQEFEFEGSDNGGGFRSLTFRYIPPTSVGALMVARDLCCNIPGCVAIDKCSAQIITPDEICPPEFS